MYLLLNVTNFYIEVPIDILKTFITYACSVLLPFQITSTIHNTWKLCLVFILRQIISKVQWITQYQLVQVTLQWIAPLENTEILKRSCFGGTNCATRKMDYLHKFKTYEVSSSKKNIFKFYGILWKKEKNYWFDPFWNVSNKIKVSIKLTFLRIVSGEYEILCPEMRDTSLPKIKSIVCNLSVQLLIMNIHFIV